MNILVILLIASNVILSLKGFNDITFFNKNKFSILGIDRGEKSRFITSGFLHVDYIHLFFNMYALYMFSDAVLMNFSNLQYLVIYFGSLVFGNYLAYYFNKNNSYYSAVGASGAVSGIVFSSVLLYPDMTLYMFPLPFPIKGYIFGIGYLLYSIYGMKKQLGNIGHSAHLGGAIAGYAITLLLFPKLIQIYPMQVGLLAIPIIILLILEKRKELF